MSAGFRRFRITRKSRESAIITSFCLSPTDGDPLWKALPGQYLTLRIPTGGGTSLKTYSISTDVASTDETRITVKREAAPAHAPDAPAGEGSSWLHDQAEVGTELDIAAPRGSFILDQSSERPVVLLSGGVGQTPMLSMLHSLARSERRIWFVHACENGEVHAMHDEVEELVLAADGRVQRHVCYRAPTDRDRQSERFHSTGFINKSLLQSLLPIDDYDCYLCGPTPFMVSVYRLLSELGVAEERIRYEFFGKAKSLPALAAEAQLNDALPKVPNDKSNAAGSRAPAALSNLLHLTNPDARAAQGDVNSKAIGEPADSQLDRTEPRSTDTMSPESTGASTDSTPHASPGAASPEHGDVVFVRSNVTVKWSDSAESLLELAENAGLAPNFSCRSGICNTCACTIREGDVEYFEEPLEEPEPGTVLICCSRPRGRLVLEL